MPERAEGGLGPRLGLSGASVRCRRRGRAVHPGCRQARGNTQAEGRPAMRKLSLCTWAAILSLLLSPLVWAGDWPQFRGPGGLAVSDETGLPVKWSATENVRWKTELPGRGVSSPVIAEGRVYITACSGYKQRRL